LQTAVFNLFPSVFTSAPGAWAHCYNATLSIRE
jgi:hypothetical protein